MSVKSHPFIFYVLAIAAASLSNQACARADGGKPRMGRTSQYGVGKFKAQPEDFVIHVKKDFTIRSHAGVTSRDFSGDLKEAAHWYSTANCYIALKNTATKVYDIPAGAKISTIDDPSLSKWQAPLATLNHEYRSSVLIEGARINGKPAPNLVGSLRCWNIFDEYWGFSSIQNLFGDYAQIDPAKVTLPADSPSVNGAVQLKYYTDKEKAILSEEKAQKSKSAK